MTWAVVLAALAVSAGVGLVALFIHDRWFSTDDIIRNYPVVGHLRFFLIELGPKLRQYIVADNRESFRFNGDERDWITVRQRRNNYRFLAPTIGFLDWLPGLTARCFRRRGKFHGRGDCHGETRLALSRPTRGRRGLTSIVNVSAMSYGARRTRHRSVEPRREARRLLPQYR